MLAATLGERSLGLSPMPQYALGLAGAVFILGGAFLRRRSVESDADVPGNRWSIILGVAAVFLIALAILFELFSPRT